MFRPRQSVKRADVFIASEKDILSILIFAHPDQCI